MEDKHMLQTKEKDLGDEEVVEEMAKPDGEHHKNGTTFMIFTAAGLTIQVKADCLTHSIRKNGEEYVTLTEDSEGKGETSEKVAARFNWSQLAGWSIYNG